MLEGENKKRVRQDEDPPQDKILSRFAVRVVLF